ncbi:MAG TPA: hypothetical protein VGN14_10440 [Candidatus Elarobacter sp.]
MIRRNLVLAVGLAAALCGPVFAQAVIAPKGAEFEARLDRELNTKTLHDGDTFTLTEHEGWFHKAPPGLKGATIDGHVENVSAAKMGHGASMNVFLDDVKTADGQTAPIDAKVTSTKALEPKTHHLRDVGLIVGGAVAGHIASKRTGIKHGTIAGAAAGFALATSLKSDIDVKRGTIVHLKLNAPVVAQAQ